MRCAAFLLCSSLLFAQGSPFDVVISGGRVIDGAGNPWFLYDVGIRGDTIAQVGDLRRLEATLRIDAAGFIVAPGFIDIHTHARSGIFRTPTAENYLRQGVTTLMEGQDGSSPIPLAPFFEKLTRTPISVNFGMFAGQGSIRSAVLGLENRKAAP